MRTSWPRSFLLKGGEDVRDERSGADFEAGLFGSARERVTIADVDVGSRRKV